MVAIFKENLKIKASIWIKIQDLNITDNGKIKCHIIKENKKITKEYMKVNITKDKNMEKEDLYGMIILLIKDNFKKESFMESAY